MKKTKHVDSLPTWERRRCEALRLALSRSLPGNRYPNVEDYFDDALKIERFIASSEPGLAEGLPELREHAPGIFDT